MKFAGSLFRCLIVFGLLLQHLNTQISEVSGSTSRAPRLLTTGIVRRQFRRWRAACDVTMLVALETPLASSGSIKCGHYMKWFSINAMGKYPRTLVIFFQIMGKLSPNFHTLFYHEDAVRYLIASGVQPVKFVCTIRMWQQPISLYISL